MIKDRILATIFSLIAFALFVVMDSISKFLAEFCSVIQIVWGRYFFHILFMGLIFFFLKRKIKFKKNVKIENIAFSSSSGITELRVPVRDINADYDNEQKYELGIATIHSDNNLNNKDYETIKNIKKITLDEYNFSHEIGFIKIDVEGHELEIIRGGKNFLKNHKPVMLIEIEERHAGKNPIDIIDEICKHA